VTRGWTWLYNARKWHYFIDGRSLCKRWVCFDTELQDTTPESPDNCVACYKALARMRSRDAGKARGR
jgi:hypothetical protein